MKCLNVATLEKYRKYHRIFLPVTVDDLAFDGH